MVVVVCIGRLNIARWVGGQGHEHWRRACHRIIVRVDCALVEELACCFVKDRMRAILCVEPCRLKSTFDQLCKERLRPDVLCFLREDERR